MLLNLLEIVKEGVGENLRRIPSVQAPRPPWRAEAETDTLDPGKLISVTYPSGVGNGGNGTSGTLSYDTLGRPRELAWKHGASTVITSDLVDRSLSGNVLTSKVDGAVTPTWSDTYDAGGRVARTVGSGHDYQYGYGAAGGCGVNAAAGVNSNRTSLTDNGVTVASSCFDNADRLTSTTQAGYTGAISYDAHGNTILLAGETYTYDFANRHTVTSKAGTSTVAYARDATDRLVSRTETPSGGAATTHRYGYTGPGDSSSLTMNTSNVVLDRVVSLPGGVTYTVRGAGSVWLSSVSTPSKAKGNTGLGLRYEINNPIQPFGADITADGTFGFVFRPDGSVDVDTFNCACDDFPSLEIYQFREGRTTTDYRQTAGRAILDLPG